jgi:DNA-binding transcriptional LysR family regulator
VTLTRAGTLVLGRARALVFDSIAMQRDIDLMRLGDAGEVAIGAAPVPAATIMPSLLAQLGSKSPQLLTRVRFGNLMALIEKLDAQELDFCLGEPRLIANDRRYATVLVAKQRGGLFCRRGHPAARRAAIELEALRRYGVASISMTPTLLEGIALGYGFDSAQSFPLTVECDDMNMLADLVAQSDVLGLLPEGLARAHALSLRRLELTGVTPVIVNVHAVWLKGRTMSPAATRAVQLARQIGGRHPG